MEKQNITHPWWRGGVIYQIYPRSFCDTNADGVGDLPGITAHLDHVAGLGVDAVWISPFFKSPMKDFGYDVASHRDVDPIFGTNADFDRLLARAHELGLKVIIDLVLSHTSDEHPWFIESRVDRTNPKTDWYVWADPAADDSPPNNWLSVFGGSAWEFDEARGQYYLHNYLTSQPDLNFHNPEVRNALEADLRYWLDKGVDGVRLDVVNAYTHDAQLRSNPTRNPDELSYDNHPLVNPYMDFHNIYNKSRPENLEVLRWLRGIFNDYPNTAAIGEIADDDCITLAAEYTGGGDKLHTAYHTFLCRDVFGAAVLQEAIELTEAVIADGWPCWTVGNHDIPRVASRWGGPQADADFSLMILALTLSLRGTPFIYQGDELGLTEADVPYDRLQDPYGKRFWPDYKGRDGCRTPMVWAPDAPHGGFSTASHTWLPVSAEHLPHAVSVQTADENSLLNRLRRFIAWRKHQPALIDGDIEVLRVIEPVIIFARRSTEQNLLCAFNLGPNEMEIGLKRFGALTTLDGHGLPGHTHGDVLHLPGHGAFFAHMKPTGANNA